MTVQILEYLFESIQYNTIQLVFITRLNKTESYSKDALQHNIIESKFIYSEFYSCKIGCILLYLSDVFKPNFKPYLKQIKRLYISNLTTGSMGVRRNFSRGAQTCK